MDNKKFLKKVKEYRLLRDKNLENLADKAREINIEIISTLEKNGWKVFTKKVRGIEYFCLQRTRKGIHQIVHLGQAYKILDLYACQKKLAKFEN